MDKPEKKILLITVLMQSFLFTICANYVLSITTLVKELVKHDKIWSRFATLGAFPSRENRTEQPNLERHSPSSSVATTSSSFVVNQHHSRDVSL